MSDNKKYYYMRLKENFFESDELLIIESRPNGYIYSNILLKLYLKSLKNNGYLRVNDLIPYNMDMISTIVGQPVTIVNDALNIFYSLGLIDLLDDGTIYMSNIEMFIGASSTEAERKKKARMEIKKHEFLPIINASGQMSDKCPTNVQEIADKYPPEIEIEKEIDIDIDIEKEIEQETELNTLVESNDSIDYQRIVEAFNSICISLPKVQKLNEKRRKQIKARCKSFSDGEIIRAFEKAEESNFLTGKKSNWKASFDWFFANDTNILKVLEGNYDNDKKKSSTNIWNEV